MTRDEFSAAFERIKEVTGCIHQVPLAEFLGIRQSSISDAKRRATVPDSWLLTILVKTGVNPDWIRTGHGYRYLVPSAKPDEVASGYYSRPIVNLKPGTIPEHVAAIKEIAPGALVFVAYGDPQALDLGALRHLAETPAAAQAAGQ